MADKKNNIVCRHDWTTQEVQALFKLPFADLLYRAHGMHRECFPPNAVQMSRLLNFKAGACPEDCTFCSQSAHYKTGLKKEKLFSLEKVMQAARKAKADGASRFCMAAAWRSPPAKDLPKIVEMIKAVRALGLECCTSLGLLTTKQVKQLEEAGLDFYNHNLETSPEYYSKIVSTHTFQDRLDTVRRVCESKINVCCGGLLGMGEDEDTRIELLKQLANLPKHPQSVSINCLIHISGTPLAQKAEDLHPLEFVRAIACARIMMPRSCVRLSGGRNEMNDETQALCFFAGANSIHFGEKLLTTPIHAPDKDKQLLERLGITPFQPDYCNV